MCTCSRSKRLTCGSRHRIFITLFLVAWNGISCRFIALHHTSRKGTAPNGTKYFTYTADQSGQFWQDWLSGTTDGSKRGNYLELQIGPAPSQMQTFSHPAESTIEWTEYIMVCSPPPLTHLCLYSRSIVIYAIELSGRQKHACSANTKVKLCFVGASRLVGWHSLAGHVQFFADVC